MDLPKRKPNRLPEHDYSTPGAYFITFCTKDRKKPVLGECRGGHCVKRNIGNNT